MIRTNVGGNDDLLGRLNRTGLARSRAAEICEE